MVAYQRISIITPSYNNSRYIEDAIQSVVGQNYPDVEHLIIDGGSNDGTLDVLKKYPHLKWISEKDEGQSDALNKGFKMATGDILGWLNADDYYQPGIFFKINDAYLNNPAIDFLYGEYQYVTEDKQFVRKVTNCKFDKNMLFFYGCYIPSTASFFRRRIIEDGVLIDKNLKIIMDKDFFTRIAIKGYQFQFVSEVMASFRLREDNVGNKFFHKLREENIYYLTNYHNNFCYTKAYRFEWKLRRYYYLFKRQVYKYVLVK
ncbi:MAG: glycosyltransferase [Calditrichaceae bacterium]|nr:glycosyltransferase [Calditrichia bacterium]NUQ42881.1 glycosyltransferase [Calditrichaceae bacterium]